MSRLYIVVFISFISFIGLYNIFKSDVTFSEGENRILAKFPEITKENVISGKFSEEFELYLSDNFKNKENWLLVKSLSEKSQMRVKSNGIYYGKHGYLFEEYKVPSEQLIKNIGYINSFNSFNKDIKSNLLLVPTSIEVYKENLPNNAESYNQKLVIEKIKNILNRDINYINIYDSIMDEKDSYIYFKTDHHWTMRGAYVAYIEASKVMGFEPYGIDKFSVETVSEDFRGTHYSKVNMFGLNQDKIEVFKPRFENDIEIIYSENTNKENSLYNETYLNKKDKYSYFLNGNHSLVEIKTNVKNGRKLMVVKDSYANVLIPFLTYHYEEIYVVDLRYNKNSLSDYMEDKGLEEVIFIYNLVNFTEDKDIIWLKK